MNNKHHALWAVTALLIVFLAILIWRVFIDPTPRAIAPDGQVATTTAPAAAAIEPIHIKDSGRYYEIDASYPSATPLRETAGLDADADAVALMKSFEVNTIEGFKEANNLGSMTPEQFAEFSFGRDVSFAMTIDYKLIESPKTISYSYAIYQDTLGAHPNTYYRTFTFDRQTGENIHLDELFAPGMPYLERLSSRTRADLPAIMAKMAGIRADEVDRGNIESGTLPIADAFQNFVIDAGTLRVIFPPYQVGPYAFGTLEVPIPLTDLRDILSPQYRP
ncbi:MAG TPA: DUF3298 domain-containing protein [Candidatus Paceibacterota bacterium]